MTIEVVLRKDKANKKGECPIAVRINAGNKVSYKSLGIRVLPEQFSNGRVANTKLAAYLNAIIDKYVTDLRIKVLTKQAEGEQPSLSMVQGIINPFHGGNADFMAYFSRIAVNKTNPGTRKRYGDDYNSLRKYFPNGLQFADITPAWLTRLQNRMLADGKQWATMRNMMKSIRHVFNVANDEGITNLYPFKDWKYPAEPPQKAKVYLSHYEIAQLRKYLDVCPKEFKPVLAYFLVECHSGIRFSDWGKERIEKHIDGRIDMLLRTTKTGTEIRLPVDAMPDLHEILQYIDVNGIAAGFTIEHANRVLKLIGAGAGINKTLTTHVGRHTAASNLMNMDGLSERTIAEILGITVKMLVTTYAHLSADKIRREFERVRK